MASSAICKDDVQGYPDAHLLGIALELRQKIYAYILTDIHSEPRDWEKVPTSSYDGLRYVCKQLCLEIKDSVFAHLIPKVSLDVVSKLSVNKTNVHKFRSLYLEMGLDFAEWWYFDLSRLLNQFQLSLQELHLIFTGLDELGGKTGLVDCGNHQRARVYPMLPLSKKGQGAEKKLKMLRHIRRSFSDKAHLRALSVTSDPRSKTTDLAELAKRRPKLFRGLIVQGHDFPAIEALTLDANSVQPMELLFNKLATENLRQLSWRVPNMDYHGHMCATAGEQNFLAMTRRLLQTIWRIPNLESLRMCINIRTADLNPRNWMGDRYIIVAALSEWLPECPALESLEIHATGVGAFYSDYLIDVLPHNLRRLYLTDNTTSIAQLARMVDERFFGASDVDEFVGNGPLTLRDDINMNEQGSITPTTKPTSDSFDGLVTAPYMSSSAPNQWSCEYLTGDEFAAMSDRLPARVFIERQFEATEDDDHYMETPGWIIGEIPDRDDYITVNTGKLCFVIYEYACASTILEDRLELVRLNGRLIERAHNFHLACTGLEGIKPKEKQYTDSARQESSVWSQHQTIVHGLYDAAWMPPKPEYIEQILAEQEGCLDEGEEWYFGQETEAEEVFEDEAVAKPNTLTAKSMPIEIEVEPCTGCRWMSPDHVIPPVGDLPLPKLPRDWKDDN